MGLSAAIVDTLVERVGVHIILKQIVKTAPKLSVAA